ncbi:MULTISPECIES: LLM class flavin-dependent oxidoreductase [Protofrankia]|uniref:LLM class flavin-dependent oxidoreductase n=1 Tax=Protofrankia TaxID=2994361 RepID=UPI00069B2828|nr:MULTISPECIES: LLM class flavin-dependent oxidoreductase [Protofrankia]ONH35448.1 hypothetical protein BL254_10835 [Protofrankia sp. BMG5.30]
MPHTEPLRNRSAAVGTPVGPRRERTHVTDVGYRRRAVPTGGSVTTPGSGTASATGTGTAPLVLVVLDRAVLAELLGPRAASRLPHFGERLDAAADAVLLGADPLPAPGPAEADGGVGVDPSVAATVLSHHTRRTGLVVAATVRRDHPYNLARRLTSIDHASGGRIGLLIDPEDPLTPAGSPWTSAEPVAAAADAVVAIRELWRSWPVESVTLDRTAREFTQSQRIVAVDHRGAFDIAGPFLPFTIFLPLLGHRNTGNLPKMTRRRYPACILWGLLTSVRGLTHKTAHEAHGFFSGQHARKAVAGEELRAGTKRASAGPGPREVPD